MVIEFFQNKISKCPNLMMKRTYAQAYRLLLSLSNEQFTVSYDHPVKGSLKNRAAAAVLTVKAKKYSEEITVKSLSVEGAEHDASIAFGCEAHITHHLQEENITSCG